MLSVIIRTPTSSGDQSLHNVSDIAESIEIPLISNQPAVTGTNDSSLFSGTGAGKIQSWSITVY